MPPRFLVLGLLIAGTSPAAGADQPPLLSLRDGDRIVLIGGTLLEREQRFGHWEHAIITASPDKRLSLRNLGWGGDTVWAESRGIFDPAEKGYARLIEQARELQPTVFLLHYGGNEAWAGPAGLERFLAQYRKLLADLRGAADSAPPAGSAPRFVLLGPLPMESGVGPQPNPSAYNGHVRLYADAISRLASEQGAGYLDLAEMYDWYAARHPEPSRQPLTDNGLHLTESGFRATAPWFSERLVGVASTTPDSASTSELLIAIRDKNELYFHRWRPQNVTYLFLFRKHEQGQNAVEIPQFDPLIAAAEDRIQQLSRSGQ